MTGRSGTSEPTGRHWNESEQRRLAGRLRRAGLSEADISPWLTAPTYVGVARQADNAVDWLRAGFSGSEAVVWDAAGLDPVDASKWAAAGYTTAQAEYAQSILVCRVLTGDVREILETETDWRESGIPPMWVCRCLGAGITSVAEARHVFEQSKTDPTVADRLRMLAGLAEGDFNYLEMRRSG